MNFLLPFTSSGIIASMLVEDMKQFITGPNESMFIHGLHCLTQRLPISAKFLASSIMQYTLYDENVHTISYAVSHGYLFMLKHLHKNGYVRPERVSVNSWGSFDAFRNSIESAAENGHIECIKYLCDSGIVTDPCSARCIIENVAKYGLVEVLDYLFDSRERLCGCYELKTEIFIGTLLSNCIPRRRLNVLQYLGDHNYLNLLSNESIKIWGYDIAIRSGWFEGIKYFHENGFPAQSDTLSNVLVRGMISTVEYLHESGVAFPADAILTVVVYGYHIELVKYVRTHGSYSQAILNDALYQAAIHGRDDIAEYLFKNGAELKAILNRSIVRIALKLKTLADKQ